MRMFELNSPFFNNPACELHVRAGMPGVVGQGQWAQFSDGRILGRSFYCGVFLCDTCLRAWRAVAVFLPDGESLRIG